MPGSRRKTTVRLPTAVAAHLKTMGAKEDRTLPGMCSALVIEALSDPELFLNRIPGPRALTKHVRVNLPEDIFGKIDFQARAWGATFSDIFIALLLKGLAMRANP